MHSGSYYGAPTLRQRWIYPGLGEKASCDGSGFLASGSTKSINDATDCNKYASAYRTLSGGIMVMWCEHRIAVGFHIIARGEGRNDVFSPIYCKWREAPTHIIYDFACNLHKYCLNREPKFFRDTKFLIDQHHQGNHIGCSEAYRLSTFKQELVADLVYLNDSAAECGNSGLSKLKTSARYMSKQRFMKLCRLQLEVQNRRRIKQLKSRTYVPTHNAMQGLA